MAKVRGWLVQGRRDEALALLHERHTAVPTDAEAGTLLAEELVEQWRAADALVVIQRVLVAHPDHVKALCVRGSAEVALGRAAEGVASLAHAARLSPGQPAILNNLGNARLEVGDAVGAAAEFRRALTFKPGDPHLLGNLGATLLTLGLADEAIAAYARRMAARPQDLRAFSELLFAMNYGESIAPEQHATAHRRYGEVAAVLAPPMVARVPAAREGRRLRLGFVSSDLRRSSVAWFLWPLLEHMDRSAWELHAYNAHPREDDVTRRLKPLFEHWRDISRVDDAAAAQQIADDAIDLLIDLNGHTDGNRLPIFARRPAPVQLTWLGYANTTGLPTVDYRITDEEADPPGTTEALHSETLLRVPGCFLCFRPPEDAPPPGPAQVERPITFGSFNQRQKIGPAVVALWSRVLKAVPGSRLLLKTRGSEDHGAAAALLALFEAGGIEPARVTVLGRLQDVENHLARYHDIDIALDTFPYAGTTTTCDTLWMGVPVVTLAGATHVSRVGVSLLKAVGLAELVARDADDYVRIAAELAADRDRLAALRQGLRERMARSPLIDAAGYARRFQALLESAWRQRRAAAG